jgi:DNA-binding XRE family transcriptional regulator
VDERPLDQVFHSHAEDIQQVKEALRAIICGIGDTPEIPHADKSQMHHPFRACKHFYDKLSGVEALVKDAKAAVLERQFNVYWTTKLKNKYDSENYEKKQEVAKEINGDLRHYGFAIRHPETGSPCMVLAVASTDGKGRYVLADRLTKRRSSTTTSLLDLFPVKLMCEPRRRESFLENEVDSSNDSVESTKPAKSISRTVRPMGDVVRKSRVEKMWTLEELAQKSGVSEMTIAQIERGRAAYPGTIKKVASALGVGIESIINEYNNDE